MFGHTKAAGVMALATTAWLAAGAGSVQRAGSPEAGVPSPAALEAHVRFLASDLLAGREPGTAGFDIAAAYGTPIKAPARGRVTFVGKKGPLGKTLVVDHGYGVRTVYGHTQTIHVRPGETVERGQRIAEIGSSGRSTGPHLHYVVEVGGKPRNPLDYILD